MTSSDNLARGPEAVPAPLATGEHDSQVCFDGIVSALHPRDHGKEASLTAIVTAASGESIILYMRGADVRGIVKEGHMVCIPVVKPPRPGDTLESIHIRNVTTNWPVSVWTPPLRTRLVAVIKSAVVAILPGVVAGLAVSVLSARAGSAKSGQWLSLEALLVVGSAGLLLAGGIFWVVYVQPRQRRRAALMTAATPARHGRAEPSADPLPRGHRVDAKAVLAVALVVFSGLVAVSAGALAASAIAAL